MIQVVLGLYAAAFFLTNERLYDGVSSSRFHTNFYPIPATKRLGRDSSIDIIHISSS